MGIVLVRMLENRKIKFEVFLDKNAGDVSEFTSSAVVYER